MKPTTAKALDKRRIRKRTDKFPAGIRITFNRTPIFFPIGVDLSQDDFDKLVRPRISKELSEIRDKLNKEEDRAIHKVQ